MASLARAFDVEQQSTSPAAGGVLRPVPVADSALRALQHRLIPIDVALEDALAGRMPVLPVLDRDAQGYIMRGIAADRRDDLAASSGMIAAERRRYNRAYVDLAGGFDRYFAMLPAGTRTVLTNQAERIAAASGGAVPVARYHDADGGDRLLDQVHRLARRMPTHRLPGVIEINPATEARLGELATRSRLRAWVLSVAGEPAAYLQAIVAGDTVRVEHFGQDPAFADMAPLALLMLDAIRDVMAEARWRRLDLGPAPGRHIADLATGGLTSVDVALLRPSLANRVSGIMMRHYSRAKHALAPIALTVRLPRLPRLG